MRLQDQILRNFLNGLIIYKRGPAKESHAKEKKQLSTREKFIKKGKLPEKNTGRSDDGLQEKGPRTQTSDGAKKKFKYSRK